MCGAGEGGRGGAAPAAGAMDGSRKRKIETRGAEAAEEEQRKKLQAKLGKVHCNYCKRDVSDQMYIKSAVPAPPLPPPRPPAPPAHRPGEGRARPRPPAPAHACARLRTRWHQRRRPASCARRAE